MSTTESTGRKTKSGSLNYKGMLIGLVIGAGVGFGGFTVIKDRQADQQEELAKISSRLDASKQYERDMRLLTLSNNMSDLQRWTKYLAYMPESAKRDSVATAIYHATKDGLVSDAEYEALAQQYRNLENYNTNNTTKEKADKILKGEVVEPSMTREEEIAVQAEKIANKMQGQITAAKVIHYANMSEGVEK